MIGKFLMKDNSSRERYEKLQKLREERMVAENMFNEVTDKDAIDSAIYMINATERKEEILRKEVR